MDAVLGLSMTPTSVGLVLVEGQDADGATMEREDFGISDGVVEASEQATAAVLRTEAIAATRGLRLHSIGVTWSEDADAEASKLLRSLSESGFDNVVAIRMPEATEALARGIADVLGYATTAVCVVEPDSVITLIINTSDGAVQTAFNHAIDSDEALISWLSTVFARADWAPEALVVVGSAGGFESILTALEETLSVPVFAPEEAKLALARGAALASAQSTEMSFDMRNDDATESGRHWSVDRQEQRRRTPSLVGPTALLVAGVVTFVVSVSIAVSLQFSPGRDAPPSTPVPAAQIDTPAAVRSIPSAQPPPVAIPATPVVEAPLPAAPPAVDEQALVADVPVGAPVDQAPAQFAPTADAPVQVVDPAPVSSPADAPPLVGTQLPPDASVQTPYIPPVPTKKPGILTRIKERLIPGPG